MKNPKLSTYILLDRSGSMSGPKWEHAIGSINDYVNTLRKDEELVGDVTVVAFDGKGMSSFFNNARVVLNEDNVSFDILRENQSIDKFKQLAIDEVSPRGSTPLYDATARLLNMAESNNEEKTLIIIMTDGEENASQSYSLSAIKDRIQSATKRGWEVIFLGSEFNADNTARNLGLDVTKVVNNKFNETNDTMKFYGAVSSMYARGTEVNLSARRDEVNK